MKPGKIIFIGRIRIRRINSLIKDIERNKLEGIGKPEPLRGEKGHYN